MTDTMKTELEAEFMNAKLEADFRDFATTALRLASQLLAAATPRQLETLQQATAAGGRLSLEFGPVPVFTGAQLWLTEQEGARHLMAEVTVIVAPPTQ